MSSLKSARVVATVLCALGLFLGAARAQTDDGDEQWFVVRIAGAVVGTATERFHESSDGISYQAHMNIRFNRLGTPISLMMFTEEISDSKGRFQRARIESSLSNLHATAVLDGDSVHYESRVAGASVHRVEKWDPAATSEAQAAERVRAWIAGGAPEMTLVLFDVAEGGFRKIRMVKGERTTGPQGALTAVDEYDEGAATPSSTTWYDDNGDVARTLVRQLGIEIDIARISQAELASIEIEPDFDIIRQSMVRCDNFPTPVANFDRVTLQLDFPGTPPAESLDGPNQDERARDGRTVVLVLARDTLHRERLDTAGRAPFLKPDRFVQSNDPSIRAVADSIRAAAHVDGWPLARTIASWVNDYIVNKGMEQGYASALDVMRTRSGDCTEHSLLAVAVLRAAGIPARPVVGLAFGESEHAFVGHMWAEAYVDGWRTLDALDERLDPIRLRVYAPAASESLGERDLMRAYGAIAGVAITAIDSEKN
jgi:hypothetical protein